MKDIITKITESINESHKENKDKESWKFDIVMQYITSHLDDKDIAIQACEIANNLDLHKIDPNTQELDYWTTVVNDLKKIN